MSSIKAYYEQYWVSEQAPPEGDPLTEERIKRFLAAAQREELVLDLGCGSGRSTHHLKKGGKRAIGLDVSQEALRRGRRKDGTTPYLVAACDAPLPLSSSSLDAVYCAEVVEHVLDPETMVRECHRILKPGGILFITTPFHGLLKNLAIAAMGFDRHFNPIGPHIRFFTLRSLRALLERNGFKVEGVSYLGRFWPFWMNMVVYARK